MQGNSTDVRERTAIDLKSETVIPVEHLVEGEGEEFGEERHGRTRNEGEIEGLK